MAVVPNPKTQFLRRLILNYLQSPLSSSVFRRYFSGGSKEICSGDDDDPVDSSQEECMKAESSSSKSKAAIALARIVNRSRKSLTSDLQTSTHSSFKSFSLSKTTVLQVLRLIRSPPKALEFFDWVQHKGFTHDDKSYFLMLEILGRNRYLNVARNFLFSIDKRSNGAVKLDDKFFNSLIRSYGRAGLFQESIKIFSTMKSMAVSPSVFSFNSLFSILLKRGRTGMTYDLYDEMLKTYGVTPDVCTFNTLIRGFCMNSMVAEGFRFFRDMDQFGCEPDILTYNTLVDGLCRAGKVKIAHNIVKGMFKRELDLEPNVVTYTTLIRGYCAKQEINEAVDVFNEMMGKGLKPSEITYNTLVQGLCEARELDKVKDILQGKLGGGDFVPDTCTFNTLMNAHCSVGNLDAAMEVYYNMSKMKVPSDSATYSILIRSCCKRKDFGKAEELFDELADKEVLLSDTGCRPLVAAYNPMFKYLCANGKTKKAEILFRQLMRKGIQDPLAYETLIKGHCKEGMFVAGYDLLVLMLRRDFVPDVEIFNSLIDGLLLKGEPNLATDTLERMLRSPHRPKTSTFHSILSELVRKGCDCESANFMLFMLEKKVRPNLSLSTDTVRLLLSNGLKNRAHEVVQCLYGNGYVVKMDELIDFLCQKKKLLEARDLLLFSLEKDQRVDLDLCKTVLTGLCKLSRGSEAFGTYYELLEKGAQLPVACLKHLKTALVAEGRSRDAEFVSKRILSASDG